MTLEYHAPLRDMRFVIEQWLDSDSVWRSIPEWSDLDSDTAMQVLEEAARFVSEQLAPINSSGDLEGCQLRDGAVTMPAGFRESYLAYVEGGWPALSAPVEYGGQNLPQLLEVALQEMIAAANHAWLMMPGLTHGASACLLSHGSKALKHAWLPKIVTGEWLTTMCLTEPQAGTDVGLVRTKAESDDTGEGYRISGEKIFISGGDHDLTENIVHLVLARLPGAPAGTRGLSLFLVPKWYDDPAVGRVRNDVHCNGIEKKMGLKASPTCTMHFNAARGWLIGQPHRGLGAMFVMMNAARLQVAMQGVGHAQVAWQRASAYARERIQMRAVSVPDGFKAEPSGAVPIALHPAIRRALTDLRTVVEGERAIGYWIAQWIDIAARHPEGAERSKADSIASLLTPVAKAFFTAQGFASASSALQVFGGYGYIHEYGIEQTLRDSRVAMLYEGTNEVQAIDLVIRKVLADGGERLRTLLAELGQEADRCIGTEGDVGSAGEMLRQLCCETSDTTRTIMNLASGDPELPYRVAGDYLELIGWLLMAFAWARTLRLAAARQTDDAFYQEKITTGKYFFAVRVNEFAHHKRLVEASIEAALPFINLEPASSL